MKKSLLIFFFFLTVQIVAPTVAFVLSNLDGLLNNNLTVAEQINIEPTLLGKALLVGNLVLIGLLVLLKLVRPVKAQMAQKTNIGLLGWTLLGTILFSLGLSLLLESLQLSDNGMIEIFQGMKNDVLCLLLLVFIGPLTEELVFREGILRSLWEKQWAVWCAALTAAVLFAIVHGNLAQAIPAAILGFVLGLFYIRSGNLSLCFPAHALNNGLAALLLYFPEWETALTFTPLISVGVGLIFCAAAFYIFHFKLELSKYLSIPYKQ